MPQPLPVRPNTYAGRADAVADRINRIADLRSDPHAFHQAKDEAARAARKLADHLRAEGL